MREFSFDKFVDDICKRESESERQLQEYGRGQEDLPQRRYIKLYRELPQNRIVYRSTK